ncbi:MAG: MFS transporter [Caulobacterales bacterium]|nr:MFS transporter [Caulobacterales bacterium]
MNATADAKRQGYGWYVVGLVCALYILSYLDRLILGLLVQPIQAEISVSDTEMSLLFGMAFAGVFAIAGLPLARIADTRNRKALIIVGVMVWCVLTMAAGFARDFPTLLACRIGVAAGEAALLPAALSIISDLFVREKRSLPVSMVMTAGMIGASASFLIGAVVIDLILSLTASGALTTSMAPWRLTLIAVGMPGIVLGLLFAATVSEPPRTAARPDEVSIRQTWRHMVDSGWAYFGMLGGVALLTLIPFSLAAWFPTFLIRKFDLTAQQAGYSFGSAFALCAVSGSLLLPWIADRLSKRGHGDAIPSIAAVALVLGTPFALLAPLAGDARTAVLLVAPAIFFLAGAPTLATVSVHMIAPPRARAQLQSVYLMMTNIIGLGIGPTLTVLLSEWLFDGPADIGLGIAALAAITSPVALIILFVARRDFARRYHESAKEAISNEP